jgi:ABC-type transport system substrate-binding protein
VLAAEIPDIENGGVAADGMSVTWKLKTGVQWHDGQPFTADDVVSIGNVGAPPDPEGLMRQFLSSEISAKENKWQRGNATRWRNEAYDNLLSCGRGRTRSGQASGAVHCHE